MAKRKTTMALEADLLRAVKIAAAREDKAEYEVVEDALRAHLGLDVFEHAWDALGDGMEEDEALALAYKELKAERRRRAARSSGRRR